MIRSKSFTIEHPRLEKIFDNKGYSCWLFNFNFEVEPLKVSLGVSIRPDIEVISVILEDDVLQITTLEIGIEGDIGVESVRLLSQFDDILLVLAGELLEEMTLQLAVEVLLLHKSDYWPQSTLVVM